MNKKIKKYLKINTNMWAILHDRTIKNDHTIFQKSIQNPIVHLAKIYYINLTKNISFNNPKVFNNFVLYNDNKNLLQKPYNRIMVNISGKYKSYKKLNNIDLIDTSVES